MPAEIEPSVHMRLYALSKRQFLCVFLIFIVCFVITVIIGALGPPITVTFKQTASDLSNKPTSIYMQSGPFHLLSPVVSTFNQQMWLMAKILVHRAHNGKFDVKFKVGMQISGASSESKTKKSFESKALLNHISVVGEHNRSRELRCSDQSCDEMILMHLGFLDYPQFHITVRYYNLDQSELNNHVNNTIFYFHTYNPSFTQLEIWFRFVFIILTFIYTVWFIHGMRKFSLRDWGIEQKWIAVLLPLLLLYNNPLFPLTFLVNSWLPGMVDAMFQATFLCGLLLFWLCLYHGVRQNDRRFLKFYFPKMLIVGLIWISAVTLSSWQQYNELQDPMYNYKLDTGNFTGFKIFFFAIGGIYVLFLTYLVIRAYAELRNMPYFDLRLKFLTALIVIVVSVSCAIMVLRFGSGVLQDNFVAEISTHYQNSAEFLSFYGLLNLYLYTMAYVYSPSKNADRESHFRDNPTISMLNDSDEDAYYGSEEETTLTSRSSHRYDSENE